MTLYHFTCDHGHAQITERLIPASWQDNRADNGPGRLVWMTDLAVPNRDALGLTSHILSCDRTAHRYRVTSEVDIVPWLKVRRAYRWAEELESAEGARPAHWFVSGVSVPVAYAPLTHKQPSVVAGGDALGTYVTSTRVGKRSKR